MRPIRYLRWLPSHHGSNNFTLHMMYRVNFLVISNRKSKAELLHLIDNNFSKINCEWGTDFRHVYVPVPTLKLTSILICLLVPSRQQFRVQLFPSVVENSIIQFRVLDPLSGKVLLIINESFYNDTKGTRRVSLLCILRRHPSAGHE